MTSHPAVGSFFIQSVSAGGALGALDHERQASDIRCNRLEAITSRFGLTDQQKDEIHQLNAFLHKKMGLAAYFLNVV